MKVGKYLIKINAQNYHKYNIHDKKKLVLGFRVRLKYVFKINFLFKNILK